MIFFRWAPPRSFLIPLLVVGAIWLYVFLYVGISVAKHHSSNSEYFVPTPYWCWISPQYGKDRVSQEYFWLWFAALFSIVLYVPLFFVIRHVHYFTLAAYLTFTAGETSSSIPANGVPGTFRSAASTMSSAWDIHSAPRDRALRCFCEWPLCARSITILTAGQIPRDLQCVVQLVTRATARLTCSDSRCSLDRPSSHGYPLD